MSNEKNLEQLKIVKLSPFDMYDKYEMLQSIGKDENEFTNPVHGKSFDYFKNWLVEQDNCSKGIGLPEGYVKQSIYWLENDSNEVLGIGKIRHELTEHSRAHGGNIGYAIDPAQRGKGYATQLLKMLLDESRRLGVTEKILTVKKYNYASYRVIEKNGGLLFKETEDHWYFSF